MLLGIQVAGEFNTDPDMEQLIANLFDQSIQAKIDHSEALAQPLLEAASLITGCLLQEGKLLVCAEGISEAVGRTLVHCMMNGVRLERPGLPTLMLNLTGDERATDGNLYSGQLRALSQPDDTLIIISPGIVSHQIIAALTTAQQCDLNVVALSAPGHEPLSDLLRPSDVELFANNDDQYCIQEIHMLAIFCLCELVEKNLFGASN